MAAVPGLNFAARLAERLGDRSWLIDAATGEKIPPAELRRLIPSFGAYLLSNGLKTRDRILIGGALPLPRIIAYLGSMYAGLAPVVVDEALLAPFMADLVKRTRAKALWTQERLRLDGMRERGFLVLCGHPLDSRGGAMPPAACEASDLAALMATSGSSGMPRFVMVSHGNLIANTEAIIFSQNLLNDERAMLILPLSYCFAASVLHTHLYQGGGVVVDRRFKSPDKVLHAINEYECTTFAGVPAVYNTLLQRSNIRSIRMPTLRRFLQAGGPLAPECVVDMRITVPSAKFYVMYGQTEATARISCLDPEKLDEKMGSVGCPLENLTVRIIGEDGKELSTGQVGEIIVKGPSITLGYLDEPEESHRVFKDGWLHTGDLGHLDADGYIWIDGRKGAFVKMRGVRVSFAEIETKIADVRGVFECAANAVAHPEFGEALVLYIVPDKEVIDVVDRVRCSLPSHWLCVSINVVSEIPKTASGKALRRFFPAKEYNDHRSNA